jgi:hypothetical protein
MSDPEFSLTAHSLNSSFPKGVELSTPRVLARDNARRTSFDPGRGGHGAQLISLMVGRWSFW